nr:zinc finger, CCHC-type [Tanacetum cinerariifolium]
MASMNTRLNIDKLNGNIVQKHRGSKQVRFKQLGPGVETRFHRVHDEKRVLFKSGLSNIFWAKDITRSTYLVIRSPSSAIGFKNPLDMLGFFCWLASIKQGMLESVKFKCIFLGYHKSIVSNKIWRLDDVTSKVMLYKNMGFNESMEYKKILIGFGVGTSSMQVLHGFEFEVEPLGDHTFEAVIWATKGLLNNAKGNVFGMKIVRDQSSNTLRVLQSRFYNEKLVQTLLEGHSILSLKGSLSGNCNVEKNGRSITVISSSITRVYDTYKGYKGGYLAKRTRNRVRIRAKDSSGYCYKCLVKGYPWFEVPSQVEFAEYQYRLIWFKVEIVIFSIYTSL